MRPNWTKYFLELAELAATRSTCPRAHVGCVLVKENRILATGYNGSIPGAAHCDEIGCLMVDGHCQSAVHSEASAIFSAAKHGISLKNSNCFVTHFPCFSCFKSLASAGINKVIYKQAYLNGLSDGIYQMMLGYHNNGLLRLEDSNGFTFDLLRPRFENGLVVGLDS